MLVILEKLKKIRYNGFVIFLLKNRLQAGENTVQGNIIHINLPIKTSLR